MRHRLEIQTLGGLFITLGGERVTGFDSKKVAALLVYLACTERTYPREVLAEFFWEGRTQSQALSNLRVMINSLGKTLESFVVITRQSASMNFDSGYVLDVNEFLHRLNAAKRLIAENGYISAESAEELKASLGLYVGDFLEGFYDISEAFDDWALRTREGLWGEAIYVLDQLVNYSIGQQDYRAGLDYARRFEVMDSYNETAHRHLMLLYAMLGQRHTAIEQYDRCRRLLADELDVEPSAETVRLYEQIRADELDTPAPAVILPSQPKTERYEVLELVGQGSMGEVYRGIDTYTQTTVAIKVLRAEYVKGNPDAVTRFVREGEMLQELNHPNIVKVIEVLQESDAYRIITEYMEGTLADLLRRKKGLPIERILEMALDLSDALTRAHRLQIIHRDIKPANILINENGKALLADFGLARIGESGITEAGSVVGTIEYLSPEALEGDRVDTQADIWSFGVTLYEMLTGQRPFLGQTVSEIMAAIVHHPTPDLEVMCPEAPIAFIDLIYRMLDKNQEARIRSVRQVGLELEAILAAEDLPIVRSEQPQQELMSRVTQSSFAVPINLLQSQEHNLPEILTSLVGRDAELQEIKELLSNSAIRLVTIVGAGGVGKTRLSITVARTQIKAFNSGVFFVPLSSLRTSENIVPAIAEALPKFEFYEDGDAQEQLLNYLHDKELLLVMDNFEHLLDGAYLVSEIMQAAPLVKVLVTSQEKLNLQGETVLPISGIAFPQSNIKNGDVSEYPAVELFVQSARRVAHHFEVEGDDWWHINRICQMVDGLPLGIVLAAAWVEMLSIEEIAAEIERSQDFLETTMSDVPQRQRSIRAVFDYAWDLMRPDEQAVFMKLSVFRGGFTRQAVQAIIPDASLRILMGLVNKSLLYRDPDSGRYDMHGSSHQFAAEKLQALPDDAERILEAHCSYFADFVGSQESDIRAGLQQTVLQEMENVRQSWEYAIEHQYIDLMRHFLESLSWLYEVQGWYQEGLDQFSYAVEVLGQGDSREHQIIYGWLVGIKGWFMARRGNRDKGHDMLKESIQRLSELEALEEVALTQRFLWRLADSDEELQAALQACEESIEYLTDLNPSRIVSIRITMAELEKRLGHFDRAVEHAKEGEAINRELINPRVMAEAHRVMGEVEAAKGNSSAAKRRFQDSLATYQELGYRQGMVFSLKGLAKIAEEEGHWEEAIRYYLEALETAVELSLQPSVAELLIALIPLYFMPKGYARIVGILAYVSTHLKPNIDSKNAIQAYLDESRDRLDNDAFEGAYQQGQQLTLEQIVDAIHNGH